MHEIRKDIRKIKPQKVYYHHIKNADSVLMPRDTKQTRNVKYREDKKENGTTQHCRRDSTSYWNAKCSSLHSGNSSFKGSSAV